MPYAEDIKQCNSIDDIIDYCHNALPEEYKGRPWTHPELNHGINLLASDVALNCYMSAYGDMHVTKCRAAMMNFPFNDIQGSIEIVDWGCGQGIGSATIIEVLRQRNLFQWLRKITLIEPSHSAIERANDNIRTLTHGTVEIDVKNLFLPANDIVEGETLNSIGYRYNNIIHVFSNILDVTAIDLGIVAKMVASAQGKHFVLCIGPQNGAAYRIEKFCSVFGEQNYFSQINSVRYARTRRTAHPYTCMTRCFEYNGATIDLNKLALVDERHEAIYNEYDLRLQIQNHVLSSQKARVAWKLENILSVDDIMYIDAAVNEVAVDFIIVRPNKGILLLNIFEENLNECTLSEDKKEINVHGQLYQSPIDLINLCQLSIKDGIEELLMSTIEDNRNFSLIKKAVVFSENSIDEIKKFFEYQNNVFNFTFIFGKEIIENRDISQNLYTTIGFLYNNNAFDDVVRRKLARMISPSWHSYQEGRIDMQPIGAQKRLSESSITQQKISGVAGSGKTQVLAFRAVNAMKRTGGDVLVLTYNITLANYLKFRLSEIREDFSWEKIDVYPYHQFFRIRAAECQLHVEFSSYQNEAFFENSKGHKKYSAIFVDEVQDYTTEWLRIIMQNFLLVPNGELVVFGDPKQNVYQRPLDANGDIRLGIIGGQWNRQLTTSRRFTNPRLANLATAFQTQFMANLPTDDIVAENTISNTFNFQIVTYIDLRQNNSIESIITNIINIISNDNNEARDFAVLASSTKLLRNIDILYRQRTNEQTEITFISNETLEWLKQIHQVTDEKAANWKFNRDFEALERTRKQLFTTDKRCLKISTIQSFKGWESPSVIVILENDIVLHNTTFRPMSPQTIYTAITRARENMYIINIGNDTYHNFFYNQTL
ncbi:AAA family ATPase [Bacteroides thetaiotaomicron]|uniref:AAA family ATPase n=1 Tax=Bacteroides thetaiotaomicron TaxID=818 RepID=UPI001F196E5E|nr:AAA family ATPase [Bacteroides thetaiotaomicron]MCE9157833.1 AAA family ATPase [Bacteroides thetaiotaomicron]